MRLVPSVISHLSLLFRRGPLFKECWHDRYHARFRPRIAPLLLLCEQRLTVSGKYRLRKMPFSVFR
ncbi:predicted protein [Brucella abortus bv. 4 str. 292]|uniref:Uncharacterized protein n=5 Tax=Brucella TaxID=234 RepID=Q719I5_BRUAO|nr:hypothetical protein BMEII1004 [Brucella melitensis bv. 1 str. 16M]AAQ11388.1 hypothetical protein [Brucella abortus]EEW82210.1 conserved hypothetical protein [Brucella abortus NCTC 8038]EEX57633.1 predicted protein [Brucella abortus bv. 4 str. 292]EEX60857.1 predicted protein [Brucella abortus bv. 2 str. 86/8/59]EEX63872.1 predicted protein [Brucella abortus bv. 6 str. 870]EEX79353.1 conserved hypothetical protein [Brucella abortus bv. 9 str. C68]EEX84208.1 predicted protein [Brucella ab